MNTQFFLLRTLSCLVIYKNQERLFCYQKDPTNACLKDKLGSVLLCSFNEYMGKCSSIFPNVSTCRNCSEVCKEMRKSFLIIIHTWMLASINCFLSTSNVDSCNNLDYLYSSNYRCILQMITLNSFVILLIAHYQAIYV